MDSLIRHSFVSNFYEPARDEISFHGQRGEVLGQPEMRECNRLMTKLGGKGILRFDHRRRKPALMLSGDAVLLGVPALFSTKLIESEVFRGLCEPRCGIVRHAAIRPRLQGANEGFLNDIFG